MLTLCPLSQMGEVQPGDDLACLLRRALDAARMKLESFDVLVITQKIVSKAEGRFVDLDGITPSARAIELARVTRKDARFVECVLSESTAVLRAVPDVLITRHRLGHVMANAGIDRSNIGSGSASRALLLPLDPDASAERLRAALRFPDSEPPAIVISDSFGRPWRQGVTNVAIGASGLPALVDRRGLSDRDGRRLEVTQVAFADLLAAASGLLSGEGAEGVPAVLVRGLSWEAPARPAAALLRPVAEDLFQ